MDRILLLVDDEENILSALNRSLRAEGYRILRANGGQRGLELLGQHKVGVIVSDQRMPGMTGTEFLSKARELCPDTVRMVLSGYTELNTVIDAINRGAVYKFLIKPWEDGLLRSNIREAFERYEMKAENARLSRELQDANEALTFMNKDLERSVAEKSMEIQRNWRVLQVTQEMLARLPFGVIAIDADDMVVVANPALFSFINMSDEDIIGQTLDKALPELLSSFHRRAQAGEEAITRIALSGSDGQLVQYVPLGAPGNSRGSMLIIRNGNK